MSSIRSITKNLTIVIIDGLIFKLKIAFLNRLLFEDKMRKIMFPNFGSKIYEIEYNIVII